MGLRFLNISAFHISVFLYVCLFVYIFFFPFVILSSQVILVHWRLTQINLQWSGRLQCYMWVGRMEWDEISWMDDYHIGRR